jgi:hypothetical protein
MPEISVHEYRAAKNQGNGLNLHGLQLVRGALKGKHIEINPFSANMERAR